MLPLLFLSDISYSQTCIIVRQEKDSIIAVADTKVSFTRSSLYDNRHKMDGYNNVYFAVGGIFFQETFNAALEACKKATSFKAVIDSFVVQRQIELPKQFDTLRATDWENYKRYYQQPSSSAIFFCYENGEFKIKQVTFLIVEAIGPNNKHPIMSTIFFVPYYPRCDNGGTYLIGRISGIADSVCLEKTWEKEPVETALRLMRKQIQADSLYVGPPIDMIIIRRKGQPTAVTIPN